MVERPQQMAFPIQAEMTLALVYLCLPVVYLMVNGRNSLKVNDLQRLVYPFTNFPGNGPKEKAPRGQNDFPRADHERFFLKTW